LIIIWRDMHFVEDHHRCAGRNFPGAGEHDHGLEILRSGKLDLMRSLGAGPWETFRTVRLPNALPFIFAGLNVAIVLAILGSIVASLLARRQGSKSHPGSKLSVDVARIFACW